jgi:UDP-3-O-[3-hydroxymyristoyl] N-acetylglucosamine deacetylase
MQTTLAKPVHFSGVGLHSGRMSRVVVRPAPSGNGLTFQRTDLAHEAALRARHNRVEITPLCTRLAYGSTHISTIEHLMSALSGLGIDNAAIEINGPEVPILDGSALPFVSEIRKAGIRHLRAPRSYLEILQPVRVAREDGAWAELRPYDGFRLDISIDFALPAIGKQSFGTDLTADQFTREIAPARTFCMARDIEKMRTSGLALGGSEENALVFNEDGPAPGQHLRFPDEPVRHKLLDAIGDLALAGHRLQGAYLANRPGHALTNLLLRKALACPNNWRIIRETRAVTEAA